MEATLPLLRAHGLSITTRQIAEAAGVAEGTIFGVFPDKEALLQAVQDAGSLEKGKIMATLRGYTLEKPIKALYGPLYFHSNVPVDGETANGFGTQFPIVTQMQQGQQVVVWPREIRDAPYRPVPWPAR